MPNFDAEARIRNKLKDRLLKAGDAGVQQLRTVVGIQAPLKPGVTPPEAAERATPGAPPRRVSGVGQSGVSFIFDDDKVRIVSVVNYMATLENRDHPWWGKTIRSIAPSLIQILKDG